MVPDHEAEDHQCSHIPAVRSRRLLKELEGSCMTSGFYIGKNPESPLKRQHSVPLISQGMKQLAKFAMNWLYSVSQSHTKIFDLDKALLGPWVIVSLPIITLHTAVAGHTRQSKDSTTAPAKGKADRFIVTAAGITTCWVQSKVNPSTQLSFPDSYVDNASVHDRSSFSPKSTGYSCVRRLVWVPNTGYDDLGKHYNWSNTLAMQRCGISH
jgi:hypothetical protein